MEKEIKAALTSCLERFHIRRAVTPKYYDRFAIHDYLEKLDRAEQDIDRGIEPERAFHHHFSAAVAKLLVAAFIRSSERRLIKPAN